MKLDVVSHCTIDTIDLNDSKYVVPGGPEEPFPPFLRPLLTRLDGIMMGNYPHL